MDSADTSRWASYGDFSVGDESTDFQLTVDGFESSSSSVGDSLSSHSGKKFSTRDLDLDEDGDRNCAEEMQSAGWKVHLQLASIESTS